jgi:sensor histidine kinase regulating citrate/malate metabolism
MITALANDINVYDSKKYCSHPVVNAVLTQKCVLAELMDISMDIDVYVPDDSEIQSIDLCSVFSNLLDNAIEACGKLSDNITEKHIEIKAGIRR